MVHFFHSPDCIQGSTVCLRRIPKKTSEPGIDLIHGWGLYARESSSIASILVPLIMLLSLITAYIAFYLYVPLHETVFTRWGDTVLASPT
jgi:hypothetical protein